MRATVTGSTGLIGNAITRMLSERGDSVRALVRDPDRARSIVPGGVELVSGDITDSSTLPAAIVGADVVFHAAGMPEQYARDRRVFDRVNRDGTRNVLSASLAAGVSRVVYTSTMDVFRADTDGRLRESSPDPDPKPSVYERSKQAAEREADAIRAKGLDVVFCNPASVYGPSPTTTGMTEFFIRMLNGKAPMTPPGAVSLAYVDSVAAAHLAAADAGVDGQRYLLADTFVPMRTLAEITVAVAGLKKVPPPAPAALLKGVAAVAEPLGRLFGFRPMIARDSLGFLLWEANVDSSKAQRDLGYTPMDLEEGVRRTVEDLRARGLGR